MGIALRRVIAALCKIRLNVFAGPIGLQQIDPIQKQIVISIVTSLVFRSGFDESILVVRLIL